MKNLTETIAATPFATQKSRRPDRLRVVTSGKGGKILPVAYVPVLREDRASGRVNLRIETTETVETLMNGVNVTAQAWFVPHLALDRFEGVARPDE